MKMKLQSKLPASILTLALSLITSTAFAMENADAKAQKLEPRCTTLANSMGLGGNPLADVEIGDSLPDEDDRGEGWRNPLEGLYKAFGAKGSEKGTVAGETTAQGQLQHATTIEGEEEEVSMGGVDTMEFDLSCYGDAFDLNPIKVVRDALGDVLGIDKSQKGVVASVKKAAASGGAQWIAKKGLEQLPGGEMAYNVARFYSSTEEDKARSDGTLGRTVGHTVKAAVEYMPGGTLVTDMAQRLKPAGADTFTEGLITVVAGPKLANAKNAEDVAGAAAARVVGSIPLVGGAITGFTGFLGKNLFGTETLTAGVLKTGRKLFQSGIEDVSVAEGVSSSDEASSSDDEKSEEA
jgi:hypothetical protein